MHCWFHCCLHLHGHFRYKHSEQYWCTIFISKAIAIIINAIITNFRCAGFYGSIVIIAIGIVSYISCWCCTFLYTYRCFTVTISVTVLEVSGRHPFINLSVAIIVNSMHAFCSAGFYGSIVIVAIGIVSLHILRVQYIPVY